MRYKERHPTPHFKIPPPFNAVTGQYASLTGEIGVSPYCVLMQVAAEDTYADYVICRGFDTRMLVFVDYEAGNSDKPGISVAKPYGRRKAGTYEIGEIHPALLPIQGNATYTPPSPAEIGLRLGQNPGVVSGAPESGGQPSDLDASLALLYDHNDVAINWLMIDKGARDCEDIQPGSYRATAGATIAPGATGLILVETCDGTQVIENAINQTDCTFYNGNRITANVDPCCVIHFTGCGSSAPAACCDKSIAICVWGQTRIIPLDGGSASWGIGLATANPTMGECEICDTLILTILVECVASVITASYVFRCFSPLIGETSGTLDWSGLCTPVDYEDTIEVCQSPGVCCDVVISASSDLLSGCYLPCEECKTTVFNDSVTTFSGTVLNTKTATITNNSPSTGDTYQINITLGNSTANTYGGSLRIRHLGLNCTVLSASDTSLGDPASYNYPTPCTYGVPTITWPTFPIGPFATETLWVLVRYNSCTEGASIIFETDGFGNAIGSWTNQLTWAGNCAGCDSDPPTPPPPDGCCAKSVWICINGDSREMEVDGGDETWDVTGCCPDCTSATVRIRLVCANGRISIQRTYTCDGVEAFENTSILCNAALPITLNIPTPDCFIRAYIYAIDVACDVVCEEEDPCTAAPDSCVTVDCCPDPIPKSLVMVVVGGACAGTYELLWSAGSTWLDVDYGCGDIEMVCTAGTWTMSVTMVGITLTSAQCDPFEVVFDGTLAGLTSVTVTA